MALGRRNHELRSERITKHAKPEGFVGRFEPKLEPKWLQYKWLLLFGRKVAIEVADEHEKVSKVAIQSKANSLVHFIHC